jgi:ornithine carbamoyltransferase
MSGQAYSTAFIDHQAKSILEAVVRCGTFVAPLRPVTTNQVPVAYHWCIAVWNKLTKNSHPIQELVQITIANTYSEDNLV